VLADELDAEKQRETLGIKEDLCELDGEAAELPLVGYPVTYRGKAYMGNDNLSLNDVSPPVSSVGAYRKLPRFPQV
jgi:hypothetical protein